MEKILTLTEDEFDYLKCVINSLSKMPKKVPQRFKTKNTEILLSINSKYFT